MKARILLVAEFEVGCESPTEEARDLLDAFREAVLPSEHGVLLTAATRWDLEAFAEAGLLLPNPGVLWEEA